MNEQNINNILFESCNHTKRNCKIISPCCNEIFDCRICHDDVKYHNEQDIKKQHILNSKEIKKIICKECDVQQKSQQYCEKCNICFGKYYCEICNIFDNERDIFHCDKCGNCRLGKKDEYKHCDECGACFPLTHFENRKCIKDSSNSDCPICCESLKLCYQGFTPLKCGHMMHIKCLDEYIKTSDKCPLCCKSIGYNKMKYLYLKLAVMTNPMPEEYRDKKVMIYCNDCEEKNEVDWNIIAMFCPNCDSYNTKQT